MGFFQGKAVHGWIHVFNKKIGGKGFLIFGLCPTHGCDRKKNQGKNEIDQWF
jgi:hypothetical protein